MARMQLKGKGCKRVGSGRIDALQVEEGSNGMRLEEWDAPELN